MRRIPSEWPVLDAEQVREDVERVCTAECEIDLAWLPEGVRGVCMEAAASARTEDGEAEGMMQQLEAEQIQLQEQRLELRQRYEQIQQQIK